MAYLIATDKPLLWAAQLGANIIASDIAEIGGKIGIPPTMTEYHGTDENTFLGLVASKAGTYKPLPAAGASLLAGEIYGYGGGLVIVRQSHTRTGDAPDTVPALFSVYRSGGGVLAWVANESVMVGTHRIYNAIEYVCLQTHTTQVDWTPPATPALWQVYVIASPNWAVGVAYKVNDIVIYVPNGFTYKCLQAHTSQAGWNPPAVPALWAKQ
jgi:hypothetical protein